MKQANKQKSAAVLLAAALFGRATTGNVAELSKAHGVAMSDLKAAKV